MTNSEWESLCDGCGRCCLVKLEDADDSSRTYFTDVGCKLLDGETCRCRDYPNRSKKVNDCVRLTPRNIKRIVWLPPTCAYRLLADGRDLYWWHPLVSGDPETVHAAGISVRGRVGAGEDEVKDEDLEDRIVSWPVRMPKARAQGRLVDAEPDRWASLCCARRRSSRLSCQPVIHTTRLLLSLAPRIARATSFPYKMLRAFAARDGARPR